MILLYVTHVPLYVTFSASCLRFQAPSTRVLLLSLLGTMLPCVQIIQPNFLAIPQFVPLVSMLHPCLMGATWHSGVTPDAVLAVVPVVLRAG